MRTVAVVPAHDEETQIEESVKALLPQVDLVVVAADNCSDRTAELARAAGAVVLETEGNTAKKAGALNQTLTGLLAYLDDGDRVLVADADSTLAPDFVAQANRRVDEGYSACGGNFRGKPGHGVLGAFQRNEYARYARDVGRRRGRCLVLTGTACLFSVAALREVAASRETGLVYDEEVLTEDNELTLRLLHLGRRVISPKECTLTTEVMPTWRDLARQRLRWKRGAIENLRQYGWTPVTRSYWARQALAVFGLVATAAYLASLVAAPFLGFNLNPFWIALTGVFVLERAVTVRERGPWMVLLGATVVVEMAYDLFLQGVQGKAYLDSALGRERRW